MDANRNSAVTFAKARIYWAMKYVGLHRNLFEAEVEGFLDLFGTVHRGEQALLMEPETADLKPIVEAAGKLITFGAAIEDRLAETRRNAEEAAAKSAAVAKAKSLEALHRNVNAATAQLQKYSVRLGDEADRLNTAMANVATAMTNLEAEKDLQWMFAVCKNVFAAVLNFRRDEIFSILEDAHKAWLSGEYGGEYQKTGVFNLAERWILDEPAKNAAREEVNSWIDAGWKLLKEAIKHPWGVCPNHPEKILRPIRDTRKGSGHYFIPENHVCGDCAYARKSSTGGGKKKHQRPEPVISPRVVTDPAERQQVEASRKEKAILLKQTQRAAKERARQEREQREDEHVKVKKGPVKPTSVTRDGEGGGKGSGKKGKKK